MVQFADVKMPPVQYDVVSLTGGMDQITPTLNLKAGALRDGLNFEVSTSGGYSRIAGYERYDGRTAPSSASYSIMMVTGSTIPAIGSTITGASSGATAILIDQTTSYFVVTRNTGSFTIGETLNVGATPVGVYASSGSISDAYTDAVYTSKAADSYRSLIGKPTGSGPIRGAFVLNDTVYCFRDNAGATGCNLWKATTGGWTQVNYKYQVSFTVGNVATPADGATLTQGGVTATVRRVCTQSGAWTGTAAGIFVIEAPSGGNFAAGAATLTGGATVTLSGAQTAITVSPGGKYQCELGNFTGNAGTQRIYGCDGVNKGFEFDGTTYVPITTGTTPDKPKFLLIHKNHLVWAIGSSLITSGIGTPFTYTALSGAAEIAVGEDITGILPQPGAQGTAAMAVYTNDNTFILYGTSASDWNLTSYNTGTGCIPYTTQNMNQSFVLDSRGVMNLATSLNYGNFEQATLTANIRPFINDKRNLTTCSVLNREKSQYRLYFSDGTGLYATIVNGKYMGSVPVQYASGVYMYNAWESTLTSGEEIVLGCGSDGYLYRLDKGTSFDGSSINYWLMLPFNPTRSPRMLKRYRRASIECYGTNYITLQFGYNLGYARSEYATGANANYTNDFTPPRWDSFTWDSFYWDGQSIAPVDVDMAGTAENVQIAISGSNNYTASFTLNSIILHYSIRRGIR